MTSARSLAAMLGLGLTFSMAGPTTAALAHRVPACDVAASDVPDVKNPHCQPHDEDDLDADGDVDAADVRRADTGFGGSAGTGSETTILLVGGGVLALGAAFGVRRARGAKA